MAALSRFLVIAAFAGMLVVTPALGTSCADFLEWQGVAYEGLYEDADVRAREPAFAGQLDEPAIADLCADVGSSATSSGCEGGDGSPRRDVSEGERVDVFRLRGVDPEVALGARSRSSRVYLAPGYFIRLRSHPLNEAIFGPGGEDPPTEEYRRWSCGRPLEEAGTVRLATPWFLGVTFDGDRIRHDTTGQNHVAVDAKTTVTGKRRNGLPYVEEGDRIVAHVRECTSRGRYGLVADVVRVETG